MLCVQGDARTYSYAVAISSERDPDWNDLLYFAKIIPRYVVISNTFNKIINCGQTA